MTILKSVGVAVILIFGTLFAGATVATAEEAPGTITVRVAESGSCEIEVSIGPNAPNNDIVMLADMDRDDARTFRTSKLCHRRTATADSCAAGFTEWTCCEGVSGKDTVCLIP
ncbi:hypothetical protein [Flexibacterium corallicola]|uniref:hypothetical protein n=1 Tax=Flexibacterium corallicola TaxID=3037259 RepID=UPI00286EFAF0|nr:hypothetical protein [Pseudovibrio sp. M1P-2-3]